MIAGYNTDVRHGEIVFHVQTEDKGIDNPYVESLVYVGGRVLAAKRSSYAALLAEGKGPEAISALMDHQHRAVIAAIRQGRFDTKVETMLGRPVAASTSSVAIPVAPPEMTELEDFLASTRATESERTLDQVILEYLLSEAEQEHLQLSVESDHDLSFGRLADLRLMASSSKSGAGVRDVNVEVRLISTVAEAQTLASGRTDLEGRLRLAFPIPELRGGAAALIINAESTLGSAELKHLLA